MLTLVLIHFCFLFGIFFGVTLSKMWFMRWLNLLKDEGVATGITLRFDPFRATNRWTVYSPGIGRGDANTPWTAFARYCKNVLRNRQEIPLHEEK